ncbi:MAG TPA: hypothetical protein PLN52_01540 [Opitutaceae bacterium]|nr:hypothetical protein [Opitutaceae bacterium]
MAAIEHLPGKKFAIILVDYSEKKDGDWLVVSGRAKLKDGRLFVDRNTEIDFPIPEDTYDRIREVRPEIATVVGDAEFFTTLTIGAMPDEP